MKVAVLGARGFLGSAIAKKLSRADGIEVRGYASSGPEGLDIRDRKAMRAAFLDYRPEIVVNAAGAAHAKKALDRQELFAINSYGPGNVVHEAGVAGARGVVHLSSVMVYGHGNVGEVTEACPPSPEDDYATSKYLGEQTAVDEAAKAGIGLVTLRLAMVPSEANTSNLSDLIDAIGRGRFIWVGDGENRKTMATLSDVVRAVQCVVTKFSFDEATVFNVCSEALPMGRIVAEIEAAARGTVPGFRVPRRLGVLISELVGGRLGIPASETLRKFLSDDAISGRAIEDRLGFRYERGVAEEIRRVAALKFGGNR